MKKKVGLCRKIIMVISHSFSLPFAKITSTSNGGSIRNLQYIALRHKNTKEGEELKMKKAFVLLLAFTLLLLSGCSTIDSILEQPILENSGILEHEDYLKYQQYKNAGLLDEKGQYIDPNQNRSSDSVPEAHTNQIHITFAENHYLEIWYFTDAAMTTPIDTTECYLNPGDTLYAKVIETTNPNTNLYRLSECRIVEYDAEGKVKDTHHLEVSDGTMEYSIPNNLSCTEISVIPVGEYPDRNLSLSVYYIDNNGNERTLGNAGTWSINRSSIEGDSAQIGSIESYVLRFAYDTENYFYVGSEPACFTEDPSSAGFIEFWQADPMDTNTMYRIELHQFLNLALKFNEEATVRINQGEVETVRKNKVWNSGNLQYGDNITIETAGDCTIIDGDYQHITATKDPINTGHRYTLKVVPETESSSADILLQVVDVNRVFTVNLSAECDHGICTYKLDGEKVTGEVQVQEGQELTVIYKITDSNYEFKEKSDGVGGFFHDLFKASERTAIIPITADLDGTTILPDDWFDIVEKGA